MTAIAVSVTVSQQLVAVSGLSAAAPGSYRRFISSVTLGRTGSGTGIPANGLVSIGSVVDITGSG